MIVIKMVQTFVLNTCVMNEIKQLNHDSVFIQSNDAKHNMLYHLIFILTYGTFMETSTTEMYWWSSVIIMTN